MGLLGYLDFWTRYNSARRKRVPNFERGRREKYRVDPNVPVISPGHIQTPSNPLSGFGPVVLPASNGLIRFLPVFAETALLPIVNRARRERAFFLVAKGGKNTPSLREPHRRAIKTKGAIAI